MSEAAFRLIYDGEAVRDGEMDVSDLAPALLGLAQLLQASGRVLFGDEGEVSVRVRTMRDACFDVHLTAAVKGANAAWLWWKGTDVQAAAQLVQVVGLVGGTVGGAVAVVRRLRGRRPHIRETRPGFVSLEVDGATFEVPEAEARIALDASVRAALEKVVADPLSKDGIDSVSFGGGGGEEAITKAESVFFRAPVESEADEFVSRYQRAFSIQSLSFKPDGKWRLNDGHGARSVSIHDEAFASRVERNEVRFAKGDLLICEVVETSRRTATGFKSEYEIAKVLEHRPAPAHPQLDLSPPPPAAPASDA